MALLPAFMQPLRAQELIPAPDSYPTDYFSHPLTLPVSLAGDFAEIRPNHFHSGLDLRTEGREGAKVYVPADGYVSRINISAWGGGKVLYITHPNGYLTVYMHLSTFCGKIGKFVHDYQYANHTFSFDIELPADSIPVRKGDLVALTGNTGSSGGPHLHYEIRYAVNDQPINPLYFGIKYSDPVAPIIDNIKIYPADSQTAINGANREIFLNRQQRKSKGRGSVTVTLDTVDIAGRFYTGIYTYDRMETGATNKNGVESIDLYVDGERFHHYGVPSFLFEETRAINAVIDYPQYQKNRQYYVITRHLRGDRNPFSVALRDHGYLRFDDGETHTLEYRVSDYKGNTTSRRFFVRSRPDDLLPPPDSQTEALQAPLGEPISYFKAFTLNAEGFQAQLAPNTVYENDYILHSVGTDACRLSPLHHFKLRLHPLPPHTAFTVRMPIPEKVPETLHDKLVIVCINGKDCSACTTEREGEFLTASTRSFGSFAVRLDTIAPQITPVGFSNGSVLKGNTFKVKISDNLSGVVRYDCFVNDEWTLVEHDGKTSSLTAVEPPLRKGKNSIRIIVTDATGNCREGNWTITK